MNKSTKIALITAAVLLTAGLTGLIVSIRLADFDLSKLNSEQKKIETVSVIEPFSDISVDAQTEDISFVKSDYGQCKVTFSGDKKTEYEARVENNVLKISTKDARKWYERIDFFWGTSRKIEVSLPNDGYSALTVKLSTGDIKLKNLSFNSLLLTASTGSIQIDGTKCDGDIKTAVSTGNIKMTDITCKNLVLTSSTGDMTLKNVIGENKFNLKSSTGDICFDGSDAGEITVKTGTGDVIGTLLSDKIFLTETSTGEVTVPKSVTGGVCEVKTSTGNITLGIKHK
ncbi:MAG: DUF4097 family beta strand repeat protein [Clostridia bacterium]|nr:DUF4097 family beta strand repeat protein [Clostridia bacterium]